MNIDLNKFLTNEEMLILCLDYVIMDIKANGIAFRDAFQSDAGLYVTMYCVDKLKITKETLDLKDTLDIHSERLSLINDRLMNIGVENGTLEPCFNDDGSITHEQVG